MSDSTGASHVPSPAIRPRLWDVFISHAHADAEIAQALSRALEERGFSTWDATKLQAGDSWQGIERALRSSGAVIVLLSAAAFSSVSVSREINVALDALPQNAVLPVAAGTVDVHTMPPWLASRKWLYLRDSSRLEKLVDQLRPALEAALGSGNSDPGAARTIGALPPRTPLVGVNDYLRRLEGQRTGMTWIVGHGGIGKTKLAREYAFQVRNQMDFICWLSGHSTLPSELEQRLQNLESETTPGEYGLIVLDDLDTVGDVREALRRLAALSRRHRAVVTARRMSDAWVSGEQESNVLTLGPLSREDIIDYLDVFAPQLQPSERKDLARQAESLGGSPLVLNLITQALRTDSIDAVLAASSAPETRLDRTLQVILDRLPANERHRLDVLSFCSGILTTVRASERWRLPEDDALFDRLFTLSLCTSQPDGSVFFHPFLADFLRSQASRKSIEDAIAYIAPRLPDPSASEAQTLLGTVAGLTDAADFNWGDEVAGFLADLLIWQASIWRASGDPERASLLCPRAIALANESGQVTLRIRALNLQSALAFDRGRIDEASIIERRTADLAASELGPEHPISIASLANLATSRRAQGDLAEAITLLRRVIDLGERALPVEHPDLMAARVNLAICLRDAGFADEALLQLSKVGWNASEPRMQLQEHQIRAAVLMDMGRTDEAAAVLTEALIDADRVGLSETTELLTARANLAMVYARLGRLSDAVSMQADVVERFDVVFGPDHPATLGARNNHAALLAETGSLADAFDLFSEVATSRARVLGAEHPDTLQSLLNVAAITRAKGDSSQALDLYSELLARVVRVLGPDHPMSFAVREQYARTLSASGNAASARRTFRELQADLERVLSPDHPMTQRVAAAAAAEE